MEEKEEIIKEYHNALSQYTSRRNHFNEAVSDREIDIACTEMQIAEMRFRKARMLVDMNSISMDDLRFDEKREQSIFSKALSIVLGLLRKAS